MVVIVRALGKQWCQSSITTTTITEEEEAGIEGERNDNKMSQKRQLWERANEPELQILITIL